MTQQVHGQDPRDIQGRIHAGLDGDPATQRSAPGMGDPMGTVRRLFPCQEPPDGARAHVQEQLPCLVLECEVPRSEVSPEARKKGRGGRVVEIGGLEPPTSCMPCRRSPS